MNSPGVKRPSGQSSDTVQATNGSKKVCYAQPSIMSYFAPKPKVPPVPQEAPSQEATSTPPTTTSPVLATIPPTTNKQATSNSSFMSADMFKDQGPPLTPPKCPTSRIPKPSPSSVGKSPSTRPTNTDSAENNLTSDEPQSHAHLNYSFLKPQNRRDINMRRPDDPDYDERTLFVPPHFLKEQTPALRQWWTLKQRNMDAILFFKMGKFYELFNEDAVVGVNHLNLIYMKGGDDKPAHAGFPEISFSKYADILINKGFKVMRVEQTETPAMMDERVKSLGLKSSDRVVQREVCQVTTRGTRMFGISETVFHSPQNQYLLALSESTIENNEDGQRTKVFGVCFVDVTIGTIHLGQFEDDNNLSNLNILLAHHKPTEILHERNGLSTDTSRSLLKTGARIDALKPNKEFWPIKKAISHLKVNRTFAGESDEFEWPAVLKKFFCDGESSADLVNVEPLDEYRLALDSFGAIVYYLHSQLIEKQVLACLNMEVYKAPLSQFSTATAGMRSSDVRLNPLAPMVMDHIALKNLEIFTNSSGLSDATLYGSINYCKTHFGQRLLNNWICYPLCDVTQINNRLDAVEALMSNKNGSLMNEIVHMLSQTPDLERYLSKIKNHCFKSESDTRAVMFDGNVYNKAKVNAFLNLLTNFRRIQKFIISVSANVSECGSSVLRRLLSLTTEDGLYPDYSATIEYFENSFDAKTAQKTGTIIPAPGVNSKYDECEASIKTKCDELEDYLHEQKKALRCHDIEYFGTGKNRYQLQVPDSFDKKRVPDDWRLESGRKGCKRYYTPFIDKHFAKLTTYEEQRKRLLDDVLANIFEQFLRKSKLWSAAVECIAIVDVLQSIARFARSLTANGVDMCRPTFVSDSDKPVLEYTNGRHPVLVKLDPNYISNDLSLDTKTLLLSGANMGGKSTLMRQTALLVVLAQVGCYVPASSFKLTPVDRIFSRLGASDRLLEGESTFYTELIETSSMLKYASSRSLLLLDELGRGTSTFDGTAIAYSVLKEISSNINCRCMFSTHYHTLTRDFMDSEQVRLAHMACKIEREGDDDENSINLDPLKENITFLYKITDGPAARSYGYNVAKLAGINNKIISEAYEKSKEIELACRVMGVLQGICRQESNTNDLASLKSKVLTKIV